MKKMSDEDDIEKFENIYSLFNDILQSKKAFYYLLLE